MKAVAPASTKCSRERAPALVVAAAMTLLPSLSSAIEHYEGEAYAADGGPLLYRESHWRHDEDGVVSGLVIYQCPDGTAFARKHIRATTDPLAPDFELRDARNGYVEGVREDHGSRQVFTRASDTASERSATINGDKNLIVDAGFDAFVRTHWDALASTPATILFVVPSRLEAMRFQVRHVGEEHAGARIAQRFRLSFASWYGSLLPHIDVVYDAVSRRLLRYEGISNVRDGNARNVVVRIEFPQSERDMQATQTQFAAAAAMPLTGTCPLS
ncbi:MAG: hypothetical protein ABIW82_15115 [Dokdonella sp.]